MYDTLLQGLWKDDLQDGYGVCTCDNGVMIVIIITIVVTNAILLTRLASTVFVIMLIWSSM